MSIFGKIASAIFGGPAHAEGMPPAEASGGAPANPTAAAPAATPMASAPTKVAAASAPAPAASGAKAPAAASAARAPVDVAAVLDKLDESSDEDLDWRKSIVDLMKLLKLESSLTARKTLAKELAYPGDMADSAAMNVWLHKQVMTKLAENGGTVPAGLTH